MAGTTRTSTSTPTPSRRRGDERTRLGRTLAATARSASRGAGASSRRSRPRARWSAVSRELTFCFRFLPADKMHLDATTMASAAAVAGRRPEVPRPPRHDRASTHRRAGTSAPRRATLRPRRATRVVRSDARVDDDDYGYRDDGWDDARDDGRDARDDAFGRRGYAPTYEDDAYAYDRPPRPRGGGFDDASYYPPRRRPRARERQRPAPGRDAPDAARDSVPPPHRRDRGAVRVLLGRRGDRDAARRRLPPRPRRDRQRHRAPRRAGGDVFPLGPRRARGAAQLRGEAKPTARDVARARPARDPRVRWGHRPGTTTR